MKFCLGEIVTNKAEFFKLTDEALKDYDLIEVWLDYILDWDYDFITEICTKYAERLLVLTRRNDQAGYNLTANQRFSILEQATNYPVFVDLDFAEQSEELKYYLKVKKNSKLIISYHNYQSTPDFHELSELVVSMQKLPADIYKLACYCNSREDLINLLNLKDTFTKEVNNLIVLGAGKEGMLSRLAGYLDQQPIIYAPRNASKSIINGQITLKAYKLFQEMLNVR